MTPDQFWYDNPDDLWAYWDAYQERLKEEAERNDINNFMLGQYIMMAIAQVVQFTKHPKKIYPKEPFSAKQKKKAHLTQKEYEEIRKIQMKAMCDRFNRNK